MVIDADAHVEESVATWEHLDPDFYAYRPLAVRLPEDTCFGKQNAVWIIDYKLRQFAANPTLMKHASEKSVPIPVQELTNVAGRVAAMDAMGVDRQVVFPSLWLGCLAENVELEAALAKSYNRFMAAQCNQSGGRLWYAAVLPWRDSDKACAEIRRVKEAGAAASIFARGLEWDTPLSHPRFFPIYEEAERQGLPVTVHTGNGSSPTISRMLEGMPRIGASTSAFIHPLGIGLVSAPYVRHAFVQLLGSGVMETFPRLRLAFLEAGAEWAVSLVREVEARWRKKIGELLGTRAFISCRVDEDIPYLTKKLGGDFLITATDFPHGDFNRQDQLADGLAQHGLDDETIGAILETNPARLYGL